MQTLSIFKLNTRNVFSSIAKPFWLLLPTLILVFSSCKKDKTETPAPGLHQLILAAPATQLGDAGAELQVSVTASSAWTITIPAGVDWLTLSKTTGNGNDNIIVKATKTNNTGTNRSVVLTASLNNGKITNQQLTISQTAAAPVAQVNLVWAKILGGNGNDYGYTILKTADGGHLVGGRTSSNNNGDVPTNHGGLDALVIKIDAAGAVQWKKNFGGNSDEVANAMAATNDGGYVVTGYTISNNNGDVPANQGGVDFWVIKLDATGNLQWKKTLGGSGDDWPFAVTVTSEGKIAVAGSSKSNNGDVGNNKGNEDFWIVMLESATGNIAWKKNYGGNGSDIAKAVVATNDGGIIAGGSSSSNNNGDVPATKGSSDFWVVRLDKNGVIVWSKTAGSNNIEELTSLAIGPNNIVVAAGSTKGNGGDVSGAKGGEDMWVIQLNATNGMLNWQKALGGTFGEMARSVAVDATGKIVVVGHSYSSNTGDVGQEKGAGDFWLVGLSSTGTKLWTKLLGGDNEEIATGVALAENSSYVVIGYTQSSQSGDVGQTHGNADMWLTKISEQ